jgi:hypothetical protein
MGLGMETRNRGEEGEREKGRERGRKHMLSLQSISINANVSHPSKNHVSLLPVLV